MCGIKRNHPSFPISVLRNELLGDMWSYMEYCVVDPPGADGRCSVQDGRVHEKNSCIVCGYVCMWSYWLYG